MTKQEKRLFKAFYVATFNKKHNRLKVIHDDLKQRITKDLFNLVRNSGIFLENHQIYNATFTAIDEVCQLHLKRFKKTNKKKPILTVTLINYIRQDIVKCLKTWLYGQDDRSFSFYAPNTNNKALSKFPVDISVLEPECSFISEKPNEIQHQFYIDNFPLIGVKGIEYHYEVILEKYDGFRTDIDEKKYVLYLNFIMGLKPRQIDRHVSLTNKNIRQIIYKHQPVVLEQLKVHLLDIYF
jgi:hypothetical protein